MTFAVYLSCWESPKIVEGVRGGKGFLHIEEEEPYGPNPREPREQLGSHSELGFTAASLLNGFLHRFFLGKLHSCKALQEPGMVQSLPVVMKPLVFPACLCFELSPFPCPALGTCAFRAGMLPCLG